MKKIKLCLIAISSLASLMSCEKDEENVKIHDINTAEVVSVDRFSAAAGHLQVRTATNGLPAANAPVNFDQGPFITKGIGPNQGQIVEYYNFDLQTTTPASIWVLFRKGDTSPVSGQLNIINVLPGENGYNDFWNVVKVTVPSNYKANEIASYEELLKEKYTTEQTTLLVNCPVVPAGSTATKRLTSEPNVLFKGWYKGKIVNYFSFTESDLMTLGGKVPFAPIFVSFNINPMQNDPQSGPASGFKTEPGSQQTHNVVAKLPSDVDYSPLWVVSAYDNSYFGNVNNLVTAQSATSVGNAIALVNCPIVSVK